jgi:excisionase family DNA binding protein
MTTPPVGKRRVRAHLSRAGNSIPAAAKKLGVGEGTVRRAVDRKEIQVVEFGGLKRIPDAEIERVRGLLGLRSPETETL